MLMLAALWGPAIPTKDFSRPPRYDAASPPHPWKTSTRGMGSPSTRSYNVSKAEGFCPLPVAGGSRSGPRLRTHDLSVLKSRKHASEESCNPNQSQLNILLSYEPRHSLTLNPIYRCTPADLESQILNPTAQDPKPENSLLTSHRPKPQTLPKKNLNLIRSLSQT